MQILIFKNLTLIFSLILFSSNATADDSLSKHFSKPYTILSGPTVKIAAKTNNAIGYWFNNRHVQEYELKSHASEHCENYNKKIDDGEFAYYQDGHSSAVFRCLNK